MDHTELETDSCAIWLADESATGAQGGTVENPTEIATGVFYSTNRDPRATALGLVYRGEGEVQEIYWRARTSDPRGANLDHRHLLTFVESMGGQTRTLRFLKPVTPQRFVGFYSGNCKEVVA